MVDINWGLTDLNRNTGRDIIGNAVDINKDLQANDQLRARPTINKQIQEGNLDGARTTALGTGDFDYVTAISALDAQKRKQTQDKLAHAASIAYSLKGIKDPLVRQQVYNQSRAALKGYGWTDQDLDGVALDDASLDGLISQGQTISDLLKRADDQRDFNYKVTRDQQTRQDALDKPITAADGAVLTRNDAGGYDTIYTPGTKPMTQVVTDSVTGENRIIQIPGTPGQSMSPGSGGSGGGSRGGRVMGWTPRIAENPDASVDNKNKLIAQAAGVGIDQPLGQEQFLGLDMTKLEGRPAGRHNYGNMRNTDGSWKQFNSPQEYQQAQRAWLQRRWNEGARTVRDAVEGRVANGGSGRPRATVQGDGTVSLGGGVQVTTIGGSSGPLWAPAEQNGLRGQRNNRTGEFKADPGQTGQQGPKPLSEKDVAAARSKLAQARRLKNQVLQMQELDPDGSRLSGGKVNPNRSGIWGGYVGGRVPGALGGGDTDAYDTLLSNVRNTIGAITRIPGIGSQSDYEARLAAATMPERNRSAAGRAQAYREIWQIAIDMEKELSEQVNGNLGPASRGVSNQRQVSQPTASPTNDRAASLRSKYGLK